MNFKVSHLQIIHVTKKEHKLFHHSLQLKKTLMQSQTSLLKRLLSKSPPGFVPPPGQ